MSSDLALLTELNPSLVLAVLTVLRLGFSYTNPR
jgi:hypothetical protein